MFLRVLRVATAGALLLGASALPASADQAPHVVSYGTYHDKQGNIIVFGTASNPNAYPSELQVDVDGLGANGQVLASATEESMHPVVAAHGAFPFSLVISGEDGDPAPSGIVKFRFAGSTYRANDVPVALKATLDSVHDDDGHRVQTILVTNPAHVPVQVQAIAVGYNAAGKVADVEWMTDDTVTHVSGPNGDVDHGLGAGETGRMEFIPGPVSVVRWNIIATGVRNH